MKRIRIQDENILDVVRSLPCICCGFKNGITHPHHVKTKKSGGDDVPENLMPLCPKHHVEVHKVGLYTFSVRNPAAKFWLEKAGWELLQGRWRRYETSGSDEAEPVRDETIPKGSVEA